MAISNEIMLKSDLEHGSAHMNQTSHSETISLSQFIESPSKSSASFAGWPRATQLRWLVRSFFAFLIPSFTYSNASSRKISSKAGTGTIASLDGLRGFACLIVFHYHWAFQVGLTRGFGSGPENVHYPMYRPYLSWLWNGRGMVDIFFVVSGYVMMRKPLQLIHQQSYAKFYSSLSSTLLRRGVRLYIPTMSGILIAAIAVYLGAFDRANTIFYNNRRQHTYLNITLRPIHPQATIFDQFSDALLDCRRLFDTTIPWSPQSHRATDYDPHNWTIPVEFRCGMLLIVLLMCTGPLHTLYRLGIHVFWAIYAFRTWRLPVFSFICGLIFAELDLLMHNWLQRNVTELQGQTSDSVLSRKKRMLITGLPSLWLSMFVMGVFFNSVPQDYADTTPGYVLLLRWIPSGVTRPSDSLKAVGGAMMAWSAVNSKLLEPLFAASLPQYLGKVSFSFYLVHGNIVRSLGISLLPLIYKLGAGIDEVPESGLSSFQIARIYLLGYSILLPIILCTADIFWRGIDLTSVRIARWVETSMIASDGTHNAQGDAKVRC